MSVGIPPPTRRECGHLSSCLGDFSMDLAENHSQCPEENSTQGSDSNTPQKGGLEWLLPSLLSYWQLVATMMSLSSNKGVAGCLTGGGNPPSGGSMQQLMVFLVSVAMAEKRLDVPVEKLDECPKGQSEEEGAEGIEERRRRHYCYYNYQMFGRRPPYSPLLRAAFHKRKHHHRRHSRFGPKKRTQSEGNSISGGGALDDSLFKVPKLIIRKTKSASPPTSPAESKYSASPPYPLPSSNHVDSRGSEAPDMDEEMVAASQTLNVGATSLSSYPPTEPPSPLPSIQVPTTLPHRNRKSSSGRRSVCSPFPTASGKLLKCGWTPCGKLISDGGMRDHLLQHFGEVASHISLHLPA